MRGCDAKEGVRGVKTGATGPAGAAGPEQGPSRARSGAAAPASGTAAPARARLQRPSLPNRVSACAPRWRPEAWHTASSGRGPTPASRCSSTSVDTERRGCSSASFTADKCRPATSRQRTFFETGYSRATSTGGEDAPRKGGDRLLRRSGSQCATAMHRCLCGTTVARAPASRGGHHSVASCG
jgi:hypothetical protein